MRVDSTRIILFPITRRRVKSTRTAAHESYRPACRIDTPFFTVYGTGPEFVLISCFCFKSVDGDILRYVLFVIMYSTEIFSKVFYRIIQDAVFRKHVDYIKYLYKIQNLMVYSSKNFKHLLIARPHQLSS
jgi:hypothetical protein